MHAEGSARGPLGGPKRGLPILEMGPTESIATAQPKMAERAAQFLDSIQRPLGNKPLVLLGGHRDTPVGDAESGAGGAAPGDHSRTVEQELNRMQAEEIARQAKLRGMNVTYQESLGRPVDGDADTSNWTVGRKLAEAGIQAIEIHHDRSDFDDVHQPKGHGGLIW